MVRPAAMAWLGGFRLEVLLDLPGLVRSGPPGVSLLCMLTFMRLEPVPEKVPHRDGAGNTRDLNCLNATSSHRDLCHSQCEAGGCPELLH